MYPAAFVLKTVARSERTTPLHTSTDRRDAPGAETDGDEYGLRANGVGGIVVAVFALLGYAAVLPF